MGAGFATFCKFHSEWRLFEREGEIFFLNSEQLARLTFYLNGLFSAVQIKYQWHPMRFDVMNLLIWLIVFFDKRRERVKKSLE